MDHLNPKFGVDSAWRSYERRGHPRQCRTPWYHTQTQRYLRSMFNVSGMCHSAPTTHTSSTLMKAARSLSPRSLPDDVAHYLENEDFDNADLRIIAEYFDDAKMVKDYFGQTMKAGRRAKQHCVRCHGSFTEETDVPSACVILHIIDSESCQFSGQFSRCTIVISFCSSGFLVRAVFHPMEKDHPSVLSRGLFSQKRCQVIVIQLLSFNPTW